MRRQPSCGFRRIRSGPRSEPRSAPFWTVSRLEYDRPTGRPATSKKQTKAQKEFPDYYERLERLGEANATGAGENGERRDQQRSS